MVQLTAHHIDVAWRARVDGTIDSTHAANSVVCNGPRSCISWSISPTTRSSISLRPPSKSCLYTSGRPLDARLSASAGVYVALWAAWAVSVTYDLHTQTTCGVLSFSRSPSHVHLSLLPPSPSLGAKCTWVIRTRAVSWESRAPGGQRRTLPLMHVCPEPCYLATLLLTTGRSGDAPFRCHQNAPRY